MASLAKGLQEEIKRCQDLVLEYDKLGAVGQFGKAMIQSKIDAAVKTIIEGDIVGMMQAYEDLKACE